MAYAVAADVALEFKSIDFAAVNAVVTTAQVTQFLDEATAEIDACLRERYTMPLVDASNILMLKKFCTQMVACRVARIVSTKQAPLPDQKISQELSQCAAAEECSQRLELIRKGELKLAGESFIYSGDGLSSNATNPGPAPCPVFKMGCPQW